MESQKAADEAAQLESADNDVRRAVSTWGDCDIAALIKEGGNVGPVSRLGDVVEINDLGASDYVLFKVNLR